MKITVAHLYPDLLNLYGDNGNIAVLRRRAEMRGIEVQICEYGLEDTIDFDNTDIIYIGGGSDKEQKTVCEKLVEMKAGLKEYAEAGGCILAVCSGYEILGKYYKTETETIPGPEILDISTEYNKKRLIDNIIIESPLTGSTIVGFENHSGRVSVGNHTPLGTVVAGSGNNGNDKTEGVVYKNIIATYIHGPLLPKNPAVADHLIKAAIKQRYGEEIDLAPIDDTLEAQAHEYCIERFSK